MQGASAAATWVVAAGAASAATACRCSHQAALRLQALLAERVVKMLQSAAGAEGKEK